MKIDAEEILTKKPGWVYFVLDGEFVKIGFTLDPAARSAQRRTDNPRILKHLLTFWASKGLEATLHAHFADFRYRGEWFHYRGELRAYIEGLIAEANSMVDDKTAVFHPSEPGWVPAIMI